MCTHHDNHEISAQDEQTRGMLARRRLIQGLAAGGVLTLAAPAVTGCATNPVTGQSQLTFLSPGAEALNQMAAESWQEAKAQTPVSTDPRYTNRLRTIGSRISRGANKGNETWDYAVFDTDTKNAFVLPGNRVGFYKGMMDFTDNDDQIAAIMGHEVGHVTGRHAQERYSLQMAGQLGVAAASIAGSAALGSGCDDAGSRAEYNRCRQNASRNSQYLQQALGLGFMLGVSLPYSRDHETQSDLLGAKYMHRAGYDPYQAVSLWEKMAEANTSRQPEFLSTHPDPNNRARTLYDYIKCQERKGSQGWQGKTLKDDLASCST